VAVETVASSVATVASLGVHGRASLGVHGSDCADRKNAEDHDEKLPHLSPLPSPTRGDDLS
jgi:hypothetical protein